MGERERNVRAQQDSYRAQPDSERAGVDSYRAQDDSDRRDRRAIYRVLAYLGLGVTGAYGLWWVQGLAEEAHDATVGLASFIEAEEREEDEESLQSCQTRNAFQRNAREGDERIVDAFESAFLFGVTDPESIAGIQERANEARAYVFEGRSPEEEDRDCNRDGELTPADYPS